MPDFSLVDSPWIICVDLEENYQEVGLRDLILNAPQLKRFAHPIPIVNASYIFLIEALLLSVYSKNEVTLDRPDAWWSLFSIGKFNGLIFENYFQKWHHRFFLFDDQYPFFQNSDDEPDFAGTAMKLLPHYTGGTGGNSATLFDHHTEAEGIALSKKEAANFLLPAYFYGAGGRIIGSDYFSDAITANTLSFFIGGATLFETLVLNLLPYPDIEVVKCKELDSPIWERERPFEAGSREFIKDGKNIKYQPYGLIDLLTWPGRKIKLLRDDDGKIRRIQMRTGLKVEQEKFPWFAYNAKGMDIRANENRAVWRNYDALLLLKKLQSDDGKSQPPQPISWVGEIRQLENRSFDLYGLGMAKQAGKQKTFFYCDQKLPLPMAYFKGTELINEISSALDTAENISRALYGAVTNIANAMLSPNSSHSDTRTMDKKDRANVINHLGADRIYWAKLEPAFHTLVKNLPMQRESSLFDWQSAIRVAAQEALAHAVRLAGESVSVMIASAKADTILISGLFKHLDYLHKEEVHD